MPSAAHHLRYTMFAFSAGKLPCIPLHFRHSNCMLVTRTHPDIIQRKHLQVETVQACFRRALSFSVTHEFRDLQIRCRSSTIQNEDGGLILCRRLSNEDAIKEAEWLRRALEVQYFCYWATFIAYLSIVVCIFFFEFTDMARWRILPGGSQPHHRKACC